MRVYLTILTLFLLTACEGYKMISGTVISKKTGKPIDSAIVKLINKNIPTNEYIIKTDSLGNFKIVSGFMGLAFGGPKFKLEISKNGYQTVLVKKSRGHKTIKLQYKY